MITNTEAAVNVDSTLVARVLNEGYGPGAWHGPDLKAALVDVTPAQAYWRPAPGRHSIAEVALHHAFTVRTVSAKLTSVPAEPFVLTGEDWFEVRDEATLGWTRILAIVDSEQLRLSELVRDIEAGTVASPLPAAERFALVLGITCHASYHAGQIQLLKRLHG